MSFFQTEPNNYSFVYGLIVGDIYINNRDGYKKYIHTGNKYNYFLKNIVL